MPNLRYLAITAFAILAFAVSINLIVDPGGVYRSDRNTPKSFGDSLIKSKYGLWWPEDSLSDREIKMALAKYSSHYDCIVIGSSHVMQVGSARKTNSLVEMCGSILNLGVSGGSIEDHFALAYLSLKDGHSKKVVLGIDPWTLAFGKDHRWAYYSGEYLQAKRNVFGDSSVIANVEQSDSMQTKLRNLLSLEYTIRSVNNALTDLKNESGRYLAIEAPKPDEAGAPHAILLRDGSLQYSAAYIAQAKEKAIPLGGVAYGTNGVTNDPAAINAYKALLRWIKSKGVEPILLMTPYHQNVWKAADSKNTQVLKATEPIIRQLAIDLGLKVVGSYNPDVIGCSSSEFFDFMHPTAECLSKLENALLH